MILLERSSPTAAHWTDQQYEEVFRAAGPARLVLVAESYTDEGPGAGMGKQSAHGLLGFVAAREVASEWELENIVVAHGVRQKGIGGRLLNSLLNHARQRKGVAVFLEVRESNRTALKLYEKAGFSTMGRRKSYYSEPSEDAISYRLSL